MNDTTLESTAAHTPTQTDICRAFNAALLLTGSTILAEATVLSAIEALDAEPLLAEVIRISVRFRTDWCDQRPIASLIQHRNSRSSCRPCCNFPSSFDTPLSYEPY